MGTRPLSVAALAALIGLAAAAGCKGKAERPLDRARAALTSAGLKLDPFQTVDARSLSALECSQGRIEGLDALLCDYGSADSWVRGKKAAEEWIGSSLTGTWASQNGVLLVLADRSRLDPSGKTIQKVVSAFAPKSPASR